MATSTTQKKQYTPTPTYSIQRTDIDVDLQQTLRAVGMKARKGMSDRKAKDALVAAAAAAAAMQQSSSSSSPHLSSITPSSSPLKRAREPEQDHIESDQDEEEDVMIVCSSPSRNRPVAKLKSKLLLNRSLSENDKMDYHCASEEFYRY